MQIWPSAQGWTWVALPCHLFVCLSKGVFLGYTIISSLLAFIIIEVVSWMCVYREPWGITVMCPRVMNLLFEYLWVHRPFLHPVVGMDSQVALWIRRVRWMSFGLLRKFPHGIDPSDVLFSSDNVLLWFRVGLAPKETWGVILIIETSVCHIPDPVFFMWVEREKYAW